MNNQLDLSGIDIVTELYREYSLQVIISRVKKGSESERLGTYMTKVLKTRYFFNLNSIIIIILGVKEGDEIVIVNNCIVQDLTLDILDQYLNQIPITLTLRSSRLVFFSKKERIYFITHLYFLLVYRIVESISDPNRQFDFSHAIIQNLICPPPPPRIERLSRQELRELIVPKPDLDVPNELTSTINNDAKENDQFSSSSALERLLKNVDEISRYCRPTTILNSNTEQINIMHPAPRIKVLSNAQRLRKVIFELVETERSYVQVNIKYKKKILFYLKTNRSS